MGRGAWLGGKTGLGAQSGQTDSASKTDRLKQATNSKHVGLLSAGGETKAEKDPYLPQFSQKKGWNRDWDPGSLAPEPVLLNTPLYHLPKKRLEKLPPY